MASSPEEATRLYYEINGGDGASPRGLSGGGRAAASEFDRAAGWISSARPGPAVEAAKEQLAAIAADPGIPDDVGIGYARWLEGHASDGSGDGYYHGMDARDIIATRPAEFVLDGDGLTGGSDDGMVMGVVAPTRPVDESAGDGGRLIRDDSAFLLRDFGHGGARSRMALRILTGPAPSSGMMAGTGTDGVAFSVSGDFVHTPTPTAPAPAWRWMDASSPEDAVVLVDAARHPWGGQALHRAFSTGHAALYGHGDDAHSLEIMGRADPSGRFRREELRFADSCAADRVRLYAAKAAATGGMSEMLTAHDYERMDPAQIGDVFDAMRPSRIDRVPQWAVAMAGRPYDDPEAAFMTSTAAANTRIRNERMSSGPEYDFEADLMVPRALNVRAIATAHVLGCEPRQVLNAVEHARLRHDGTAAGFVRANGVDMIGIIRDDVERYRDE